jgi:hypothetical protein
VFNWLCKPRNLEICREGNRMQQRFPLCCIRSRFEWKKMTLVLWLVKLHAIDNFLCVILSRRSASYIILPYCTINHFTLELFSFIMCYNCSSSWNNYMYTKSQILWPLQVCCDRSFSRPLYIWENRNRRRQYQL